MAIVLKFSRLGFIISFPIKLEFVYLPFLGKGGEQCGEFAVSVLLLQPLHNIFMLIMVYTITTRTAN